MDPLATTPADAEVEDVEMTEELSREQQDELLNDEEDGANNTVATPSTLFKAPTAGTTPVSTATPPPSLPTGLLLINQSRKNRAGPSSPALSTSSFTSTVTRNSGSSISRAYWTIKAARTANRAYKKIGSGAGHISATSAQPGSLLQTEDQRYIGAYNIHRYNNSMNISCSFDTGSLKCHTCKGKEGHTVLDRECEDPDYNYTAPRCFALSDQNFPAFLPADGPGDCIKIVRIEDGTLDELASFFLETVKGFAVPAGSVILLSSASHLNWVGIAAYTEDFVRARRKISNCYGDGILILHGISILAGTSDGCPMAGALLHNLADWLNCTSDGQRDITFSRTLSLKYVRAVPTPSAGLTSLFTTQGGGYGSSSTPPASAGSPSASARDILANTDRNTVNRAATGSPSASVAGQGRHQVPIVINAVTGSPSAPVAGHGSANVHSKPSALSHNSQLERGWGRTTANSTYRAKMPCKQDCLDKMVFECSSFSSNWMPINEEEEYNLCSTLVAELNEKFSLDLEESVSCCREVEGEEETPVASAGQHKLRIIVIGASHAERLCKGLLSAGQYAVYVSTKGWRPQDESEEQEELVSNIKEAVDQPWDGATTLVYHLYDNFIYFSSSTPGEKSLPKRGQDGRVHVLGKLVLADKEAVKELVHASVPLLRAGKKTGKIIMSPLPRYIISKCCQDTTHLCNFKKKDYATGMGERLADMEAWIDDYVHGKRIHNFKTLAPTSLLEVSNNEDLDQEALIEVWGKDPVHMTGTGYVKVGEALVKWIGEGHKMTRAAEDEDAQRDRKSSTGGQGGGQRTEDLSLSRRDWIQRSSTMAHRSQPWQQQQNWRGRGGQHHQDNRGRGGYRGRGYNPDSNRRGGEKYRPY